ncbi:MAG: hypothetical protein L5655_07565 [Thermosediminibacteraceae bacterium]|nr:hypothetical protein [Thermosediminibacteraceae bacterium]
MIIDVPQIEHGLLEKMQELLDALPVSHPKRKFIEVDLHKMLSRNSGEKLKLTI